MQQICNQNTNLSSLKRYVIIMYQKIVEKYRTVINFYYFTSITNYINIIICFFSLLFLAVITIYVYF